MADGVTMDKIVIEVTADTKSAEAQLNNLKTTIKSLGGTGKGFQKITNGLSSLNGVNVAPSLGSAVEKLAKSISKLDTSGAENLVSTAKALAALSKINLSDTFTKQIDSVVTSLNELSKTQIPQQVISALESLGKVKVSTTVANNIVKIGEAAKGLTDVDFTKLRELVSILTELKGIGDVKINLSNSTASANNIKGITEGAGNGQFVDVNKQPDGSKAPNINPNVDNKNLQDAKKNTSGLESAFLAVKGAVGKVNAYLAVAQQVISIIKQVASTLVKIVQTVYRIVKSIVTTIVDIGKSITKMILAPFYAVGKVLSSIKAKITEIVEYAKRMVLRQILRKAINAVTDGLKEGTENLYSWSKNAGTDFSKSMDDIATSMLYFKNSVGAAIAPLVNALAPAIRYATDAAVDMLNIINQLFAKLTGADTWTKAVRVATEYKTETDKASKATDKLKRSLIGLDQIHALNDNSDSSSSSSSSSGTDTSGMFATEIVKTSEDLTASMNGIWSAFKSAWDDKGEATVESIKTAFTNVKSVVSTIGSTLGEVYKDKNGKQVFSGILGIIKNIADTAANFASNFQSAWGKPNDKTSNGYTILNNLTEGFASILSSWDSITADISEWVKDVDLDPLARALSKLSDALSGILGSLGDDFEYAWKKILKPMLTWLATKAAPDAIDLVTAALEALEAVLSPIKDGFKDAWDNSKGFRDAIGKLVHDALSDVIDFLKDLKDNIPAETMDKIREATEKLVLIFSEKIGSAILKAADAFKDFITNGKLADVISKIGEVTAAVVVLLKELKVFGKYMIILYKTCFAVATGRFLLPSVGKELIEGWAEWFEYAADGTSEAIREAEAIKDWFNSVADAFDQNGGSETSDTFEGLFVLPMSTAMGDAVSAAKDSVKELPNYLSGEEYIKLMGDSAAKGFAPISSAADKKRGTAVGYFTRIAKAFNKDSKLRANLGSWLGGAFGLITSAAKTDSETSSGYFGGIADIFASGSPFCKLLGSNSLTAFGTIASNALTKRNTISTLFTNLAGWFGKGKKIFTPFNTNSLTTFGAIASNAKTKRNTVSSLFTTLANRFKQNGSIFSLFSTNSLSTFGAIASNAKTKRNTISTLFTNLAARFTNGGSIYKDFNSYSNDAFGTVESSAKTAISNIKAKFDELPAYVSNAFGEAWDGAATDLDFTGNITVKATVKGVDTGKKTRAMATGGFVNTGEMFIAREAGPELVGRFGNRTGVMNNNQIVESVSVGVENANAQQNILLREQNSLLRQMISRESNIRAYVTTSDIINGLSSANKRSGKSLVPITV